MLAPSDTVGNPVDGSASGYRRELDRATRTNDYLRVFFSVVLLGYCVSGPGLLIRFPASFLEGVRLDTLTQFHGYRPAIFALVFLSLSCVVAALARRAFFLFDEAIREDLPPDSPPDRRERYVRNLQPSPFPFVLSGHALVDGAIFFVTLVAYSFWVLLLVEMIPTGMGTHQVVGIVLGAYGLFGTLIVVIPVWIGLLRRRRQMLGRPVSAAGSKPTG
jgi:hypothetical protein